MFYNTSIWCLLKSQVPESSCVPILRNGCLKQWLLNSRTKVALSKNKNKEKQNKTKTLKYRELVVARGKEGGATGKVDERNFKKRERKTVWDTMNFKLSGITYAKVINIYKPITLATYGIL